MVGKEYSSARARAENFSSRLGIRLPILLAPMAGNSPPSLSPMPSSRRAWRPEATGALSMQRMRSEKWLA